MSSPWSSHINYHFEKVLEHLRKAISHVPDRNFGDPDSDLDDAIKDDTLGIAGNLEMQVLAFLDRFRKVPDRPEGDRGKETEERSIGEKQSGGRLENEDGRSEGIQEVVDR